MATNEIATRTPPASIVLTERGLMLQSLEELWRLAAIVVKGGLAPEIVRQQGHTSMTQEQVFLVMESGMEIGLRPLQALQVMYVVNNRPTIFGDALPGLAYASKKLRRFEEWYEIGGVRATAAQEAGPIGDDWCACCCVVRADVDVSIVRRYSWSDAKAAGLTTRQTYRSYGKRMIRMRARAFAFRDALADVLKGFGVFEEVSDIPRSVRSEIVPLSQARDDTAEPDPLAASLAVRSESKPIVKAEPVSDQTTVPETLAGPDWRANVERYLTDTKPVQGDANGDQHSAIRDDQNTDQTGEQAERQGTLYRQGAPDEGRA